jgi:hypothetical protein
LKDPSVKVTDGINRIGDTDVDREDVEGFGIYIEVFWRTAAARRAFGAFVNEAVLDQAIDDRRDRAGTQTGDLCDVGP